MQGMGGGAPGGFGPPGGGPGPGAPGGYGPPGAPGGFAPPGAPQGAPPGYGPPGVPTDFGVGPTQAAPPGYAPPGAPPGYGPPGAPPGGAPPGYGPPGAPPGYGPPGAPPGYGPPGAPPGYGPPGAPPGYGAPGAAPAKKGKGGLIALIVILVVVLLGGAGAAVYFLVLGGGFGKSTSKAYSHLPSGCDGVMRLDIAGVLKAEAFKKHVLPAVEEQSKGDEDAKKFDSFLKDTDIDPKKDIKDVVLCATNIGGAEPDIVVVIGGEFSPGTIVPALQKHSKKGELKEPREVDGLNIIEGKNDPFIVTQASDGAILIGNKIELLKSAAKAKGGDKEYGLALDKELVGQVSAKAVKKALSEGGSSNPFAAMLKSAGKVAVTASLATNTLEARITMGSNADAQEAATGLSAFIELAKAGAAEGGAKAGPEAIGQEIIKSLKLSADGKDLVAKITMAASTVEDLAKEMAKGIREAKKDSLKL
jgi:hypothetical protein